MIQNVVKYENSCTLISEHVKIQIYVSNDFKDVNILHYSIFINLVVTLATNTLINPITHIIVSTIITLSSQIKYDMIVWSKLHPPQTKISTFT